MMNVYKNPKNIKTNQDQWWFLYEEASKNIIVEPQQCSGSASGPRTIVVADTKEELDQYIMDNGLKLSTDDIQF